MVPSKEHGLSCFYKHMVGPWGEVGLSYFREEPCSSLGTNVLKNLYDHNLNFFFDEHYIILYYNYVEPSVAFNLLLLFSFCPPMTWEMPRSRGG